MKFLAHISAADSLVPAMLFYLFSGLAITSAIIVVVSRNIVRTAVALMFTLIAVAGIYFLLDAEFLAAVQLVIYAGGTLILIIFGVMLTSKSPFVKFEPSKIETIFASLLGLIVLTTMIVSICRTPFQLAGENHQHYSIRLLGQALLGEYLVPFELSSVLLLVVMIGAAYLAKARRADEIGET